MRDLILVGALAVFLGMAVRFPFAGVLTWEWLTIMNPHQMAYGFSRTAPLNLVVAIVALGTWAISREKSGWPKDWVPKLMILLVIWMTINSFFAADPEWSWPLWERTVKIYVFIFLCLATVNSKARIHAVVWILVMSIAFYGARGGVFTILTAGAYRVWGPENTIIRDNNQLALAVVMTLPLIYYLYQHTQKRWIRFCLVVIMPLQVATVLGSYSRGGVLALLAMLGIFWLRSRNKIAYLIVGVVLVVGSLSMMPSQFFDRMNTVSNATSDESFMGRMNAWKVAIDYASDHFPFGAGFAGAERSAIFNQYVPDATPHAAHSMYFEILGDHGFPALAIYGLTCLLALANIRRVRRHCRGRPELAWASDLASMLEVSLVGFYIGGAALSMAYYDGFLLLEALTSVLRAMIERQKALEAPSTDAKDYSRGTRAQFG